MLARAGRRALPHNKIKVAIEWTISGTVAPRYCEPAITRMSGLAKTTSDNEQANAPASVNLTNSGSVGSVFNIGGSIAIDENVDEGTYVGDLAVTVEY